jgi:hypothetical protein
MFASDSASSMKIDEFSVTVVSHLLSKFSRPLRHRAQFSKCLGSMPTRTSWAFLRSVIAVGTPGMFSPFRQRAISSCCQPTRPGNTASLGTAHVAKQTSALKWHHEAVRRSSKR